MADVPQLLPDILPAAVERATIVANQLTALRQDLQLHQERRPHEPYIEGLKLLNAAAAAMQELSAAVGGDADESERGQ